MKNIFKSFIILVVSMLMISKTVLATEAKIAAVVNDNIITVNDVENRVKLYLQGKDASKIEQQEVMRLTYQTLNELIDESLQVQEANKYGITVGDEQVENSIDLIAKRNKSTAEEMIKSLKDSDVDITTLKNKIAAEISWSRLVNRKLYSKISISDEEIDMALNNISKTSGKNYLVAEILLLIPDRTQNKEIKNKATALTEKIKQGVPFDVIARQFSQAPGANKGGDLGWVRKGQLADNLDAALDNMQKGQMSSPIRTDKGWHILFLRDIKDIEKTIATNANEDNSDARKNVASQLGTQRLNQMAIHYLNDLRAMALIEKRL